MINTVGGAFGPWLAGSLHDQIGSYLPIFMITIACALSFSLIIWLAGPSKIRICARENEKIQNLGDPARRMHQGKRFQGMTPMETSISWKDVSQRKKLSEMLVA